MKKYGFLGAGNMATAIINGIIKNGCSRAENIYVFDVDSAKLDAFAKRGLQTCKCAGDVVNSSDIIVLAVKPQNYAELLEEISSFCNSEKVFVSIAAGISTDYVKSALKCDCPVVRVMPNTPLLLGCGASALCPSLNVNNDDFSAVKEMFETSGTVEKLTEDKMNAVIAVNGSSPAYIYLFAKAMADYAAENGIDVNAAMNLICATLKGSAEMLIKSGDTPDELIRKVSSPGGTTLAALKVLDNEHFYDSIKSAMDACTKRAEELAK